MLSSCRYAGEQLQQSLEKEQAHSRNLLLQLQQLEASRELSASGGLVLTDNNQGSSDVQVIIVWSSSTCTRTCRCTCTMCMYLNTLYMHVCVCTYIHSCWTVGSRQCSFGHYWKSAVHPLSVTCHGCWRQG